MLLLRIFLAWLCLSSAASVVRAQTPPSPSDASSSEEPAGYRKLVADALAEYEAGRFEESRSLMLRAHALFPNARTLRGLGMVSFELREYGASVRWLEQALTSEERPLEGELRTETEGLLGRARSFAGRLELVVSPGNAQLLVDGVELPLAEPLILGIGEHSLELRAEGYTSERRAVRIAGGEQKLLRIALAPSPPPLAEADGGRRPWYRSPWLWVPASVLVVAGASTATAVLVTRDDPGREPAYNGLINERPFNGPAR